MKLDVLIAALKVGGVMRLETVYVPLLAFGIAGNKAALAVVEGYQLVAVRVKIDVPAGRSALTTHTSKLLPDVPTEVTAMLVLPWANVPKDAVK